MDSRWQERFPNMTPIHSAPGLGSINGIGMSVYGERDRDPETGTYVTTRCFIVLFLPVFCVGAYRVAKADYNSYYFVGKEPLSGLAKLWNGLVLSSIVGLVLFIAGNAYLTSDDYVDGRKLAKADGLVEDGKLPAAAELYRMVATGKSKHKGDAANRLASLVQGEVDGASPDDARRILVAAVAVKKGYRWPADGPDLLPTGMKLAEQHARDDPLLGMQTFEIVESLGSDDEAVVQYRSDLVERIVARHPTNATYVIPYAEALHEEGEIERCRELLEGVQDQLGSTEGARILGQMLAREGKLDEAHALLVPYTEGRLERLHKAEEGFSDAYEQAQNRVFARLDNGTASGFSYDDYDAADEQAQARMLNDYITDQVRDDAGIEKARQRIIKEAEIVPTALDLGIVILRRAQAMEDAEQRQVELENAEKTFLAIRGVAGETDEYRLFLGQVYYWLDKHEEGRALFDELLEANERSPEMLAAVGSILRDVGDDIAARGLTEEAYENSSDEEEKRLIAQQMAILADDRDDQVLWLQRANPDDPSVKAMLSASLGHQAAAAGDDEAAQRHYNESIATYAKLPEAAATLNNSALVYMALYRINGERQTLDEGVQRLDKAVSLDPSDSLLLLNASSLLMQVAMEDIIGDKIEFHALKTSARLAFLNSLYQQQEQHDEFVQRVRDHEAIAKAVGYMDKLLVLSPKQIANYQMKASIHAFTSDEAALAQLVQRFKVAKPDVSAAVATALEYYTGTNDDKLLADSREQAKLLQQALKDAESRGGVTFALALTIAAGQDVILATLGEPVDVDEMVRKCEHAHRVAPSISTERNLIANLLFRADRYLAAANAEYRDLREKSLRTLNAGDRIALALGPDSSLREAVLQDKDVVRAAELLADLCQRMPQSPSSWDWAMLRATNAEQADDVAKVLADDTGGNLERELNTLLSPANASSALRKAWQHLATGDPDAAHAEMQRLEAYAVTLPLQP